MRFHLLALALVVAACSGANGNTTGGTTGADAGDPVAVFGLRAGACYEFTGSEVAQNPPALGVAVEGDSSGAIWYLPDGGSKTLVSGQGQRLVYRQGGTPKMTDYLYVDGRDVLLLKRETSAEETDFYPALVVARTPLISGDHFDEDGGVRVFGADAGSGIQPYAFAFDVVRGPVSAPAATDGGFDAFTYAYSGGANRVQSASFTPGEGLVGLSVQFPGDNGYPQYELQNTRVLDAGVQSCGTVSP